MKYVCIVILMISAGVARAAGPVGRMIGSGPLTLNGKAVPATAVASLPLVAGDEIATSSSPAAIHFTDGSRATIGPNSRVKLEALNSSVALHVLSGSAGLNQAKGSRISLVELVRRDDASSVAGRRPGPPPDLPDPHRPLDPPKPPTHPKPPDPPVPPTPPPFSTHCPAAHPTCE